MAWTELVSAAGDKGLTRVYGADPKYYRTGCLDYGGVRAVDLLIAVYRWPVMPLQQFLFLSGEASIFYKVRQSLPAIISVDGKQSSPTRSV